ncbi:flagellar biosynthetic protein FliO [Gorillibacterium sp. sgz5001074]|uniref:flagellar biosynthetic protein FliO n=1 Tax=Gorillibacterium sp. sgz5001074 TaxID=3446695 RepID=UPI003F6657C5
MKRRTKRLMAAATFMASCGAYAGVCYAQSGDGKIEGLPDTGSPADTFWMLAKVVAFLIIIIGIFLLIMKVVAQKNKMFHSTRSIKSIGGLGLGPNKSVQVVQIGRSLLVLGVGNDVELVSKIEDPEEIQYILDHIQPGPGDFKGFPSMGEWLKRWGKRQDAPEDMDVTPSFQAVFQEKMQRIANRQQKVDEVMGRGQQNPYDRLSDRHEE